MNVGEVGIRVVFIHRFLLVDRGAFAEELVEARGLRAACRLREARAAQTSTWSRLLQRRIRTCLTTRGKRHTQTTNIELCECVLSGVKLLSLELLLLNLFNAEQAKQSIMSSWNSLSFLSPLNLKPLSV